MPFEESFIRENLKSKLIYKNSGGDYLVQQELVVCDGNCRADMALVTPDELHGKCDQVEREHHLAAQLIWKSYLVERLIALQGRTPPAAWSRAMLAEQPAEVCGPRGVRQELMAYLRWKRTAPPLSLSLQDILD